MKKTLFTVFTFLFLSTASLPCAAETIANYSNCDVCAGSIAYTPDEAREMLGNDVSELLKQAGTFGYRFVNLDLDGKAQTTNTREPSQGHDLQVAGSSDSIFIKLLADGSYCQFVTDFSGLYAYWRPQLFLQSAHADEIALQDALEQAWAKLKSSAVYDYILKQDKDFQKGLKKLVLQAVKAVTTEYKQ